MIYDIIIIGAGTAGISAYKEAIKYTQNILIINAGPWDTTCARVGCMPSKVLIASANRAYDIQHADNVGLNVTAQIDTSQVMQHVRQLRQRFTQATLKDVNSWNPAHRISGEVKFIDSNIIEVNQKRYQAKSFILAVGSRPAADTKWQQELGELYLTSDQVFELEQLPQRLAVIGSGIIAVELAQAMQRLGVETTIFARSQRIGPLSSPNLQPLAQDIFKLQLNIKYKTLPDQVLKIGNKVKITYQEQGTQQEMMTDYLLSATGRSSNLDRLGLHNIDPTFSDIKKLPIDAQTKQLGHYPIFIVGDAFSKSPVQHEAALEGKRAVHNCLNNSQIQPIISKTSLAIMFSSPQMASIGLNHKTIHEQNIDVVIGSVSYVKQGRAIVNGKNMGAVEVYVERSTRCLLGAELIVYEAEHLAHLLAWMVQQELTIDEILNSPFYHPTLEEGLRTALKHARRQLDA